MNSFTHENDHYAPVLRENDRIAAEMRLRENRDSSSFSGEKDEKLRPARRPRFVKANARP